VGGEQGFGVFEGGKQGVKKSGQARNDPEIRRPVGRKTKEQRSAARKANRKRLAAATAAYFEALSPRARAEEEALGIALSTAVAGIDIDRG
jgi:hypothetical protein